MQGNPKVSAKNGVGQSFQEAIEIRFHWIIGFIDESVFSKDGLWPEGQLDKGLGQVLDQAPKAGPVLWAQDEVLKSLGDQALARSGAQALVRGPEGV